jgi:alpha-beta hydrolase superfamily lysophospholipase
MTPEPPPDTVVLINGNCAKAMSQERWVGRYSARGYCVIGTSLPMKRTYDGCLDWDANARGWAAAMAVTDYYERLLQAIATPPILIGHCFGGLIVQLLLDRGLGAAGVAVSVPRTPDNAGPIIHHSPSRAPLLLVAGGLDRDVPAELVASTAARYQESEAVSGYLEYPDRCHHTLCARGWEQIADDILGWAELHTDPDALVRAGLRDR